MPIIFNNSIKLVFRNALFEFKHTLHKSKDNEFFIEKLSFFRFLKFIFYKTSFGTSLASKKYHYQFTSPPHTRFSNFNIILQLKS